MGEIVYIEKDEAASALRGAALTPDECDDEKLRALARRIVELGDLALAPPNDVEELERMAREALGGARQLVHSFAHTGIVALGADHELEDALAEVARADRVAWINHPLGHDLAVLTGDHVYYFAAKRPELRPDPPPAADYPRRDT